MPLVELTALPSRVSLPRSVRRFLREARQRIERFRRECNIPAFVPGDFAGAYSVLRALEESESRTSCWFCEWGSGFGVTTCLAAMLGFEARGIEIEGELVEEARKLADDFDLDAQFVQGSFIPNGADDFADAAAECAWMTGVAGGGHEKMGLGPEEFDIICAYPWPDEQTLTAALFEHYARDGALLLTDHEVGGLRVCRKQLAIETAG
jgi:hypothetical protein